MKVTIRTWKPYKGTTTLVVCDNDDPKITKREVHVMGITYPASHVVQSLYAAEELIRTIERVFEAGKSAQRADFRRFISKS